MLLMSFLDSDFFLASSVLVFSGFNDVGRGRFGRIAGIFLEFGNEGFEFGDSFFQFGDSSVLGIHDAELYSFSPLDRRPIGG